MERFVMDPAVLSLFASHYETDKALPHELMAEKLSSKGAFEGAAREQTLLLAMLDQAYHSSLPLERSFDTTQVCHDVQRHYGVLPPDSPGTSPQGEFGHLVGYGATYYAYLFDEVLASRVWEVVFKSGKDGASLDRENGERMKECVLKFGGSRDPWHSVADVLGDDRLHDGGEEAMRIVGSWGGDGTKWSA